MTESYTPPHRTWIARFASAFRGIRLGVRGQHSFLVHSLFTIAVIGLAILFQVHLWDGCILMLCITTVLAAEMFNSALETLAKAIDHKYNPHLADGLNIASAAVLVTAIGAAIVGSVILGYRAAIWFGAISFSQPTTSGL